jgi:hypothetical protein
MPTGRTEIPLEIRSLDNEWTFTLVVTATDTEHYPGVGVSVVVDGEISVSSSAVSYEYHDIVDFVSALRQVESARAGDASLDAISLDGCSIRIECVGSVGNILLHIDMYLDRRFPEAAGEARNTVSVTFEVDRSMFHEIISDFSKLATVCRPTTH